MDLLPALLEEPGFEDLEATFPASTGKSASASSLLGLRPCSTPTSCSDPIWFWDGMRGVKSTGRPGSGAVSLRPEKRPPGCPLEGLLPTPPKRSPPGSGIPERASIFGVSTLPRSSSGYWRCRPLHGDPSLRPQSLPRILGGYRLRPGDGPPSERGTGRNGVIPTAEEFYLVQGNSLLASLGGQGRDFLETVHQADLVEEIPLFADPVRKPSCPSYRQTSSTFAKGPFPDGRQKGSWTTAA
jgi:hypothetical protein